MPFVVIIKIEKFDENDKQEQYIHFIIIRGNILQVARYFREPHRVEEKYEQWAKYLLVLYAEPLNKRVTIPLLSFLRSYLSIVPII